MAYEVPVSLEGDLLLDVVSEAVSVVLAPDGTYGGPYSVTPTVEGFGMGTAGLLMARDVEVRPIPYIEAGNDAGGYTATIG